MYHDSGSKKRALLQTLPGLNKRHLIRELQHKPVQDKDGVSLWEFDTLPDKSTRQPHFLLLIVSHWIDIIVVLKGIIKTAHCTV